MGDPDAREPWQVTEAQAQVLGAWLIVMNHVGIDDGRLLALLGMRLFGRHPVVRCRACVADRSARTDAMPITAAVQHRREQHPDGGAGTKYEPAQLYELNPAMLRVIP